MRLRFRIGPFTFGKSGPRLSLWKGGTGVSVPLTKKNKGGTFGKVSVGPIMAFLGSPFRISSATQSQETRIHNIPDGFTSEEKAATEALNHNTYLLSKLKRYGVPWRGIQEALKVALPEHLNDRDTIAYKLVPKAMNTIFGEQNTGWKTEKRPSKSGNGQTTWIVTL